MDPVCCPWILLLLRVIPQSPHSMNLPFNFHPHHAPTCDLAITTLWDRECLICPSLPAHLGWRGQGGPLGLFQCGVTL